MWIEQTRWDPATGWRVQETSHNSAAELVMYFGNRNALRCADRYDELRSTYPNAKIIGCSGTRSIIGDTLEEDAIVAVALGFARTSVRIARAQVTELSQSRTAWPAYSCWLMDSGWTEATSPPASPLGSAQAR